MPVVILFGALVCLAVGIVVGLTNGVLVRRVGINSVITTIAMLSVVQGIALYLRPSPFGVISEDFIDFFQTRIGFIPGFLLRHSCRRRLRATSGCTERAAGLSCVRWAFVRKPPSAMACASISCISALFACPLSSPC